MWRDDMFGMMLIKIILAENISQEFCDCDVWNTTQFCCCCIFSITCQSNKDIHVFGFLKKKKRKEEEEEDNREPSNKHRESIPIIQNIFEWINFHRFILFKNKLYITIIVLKKWNFNNYI